jgi:hypothetical protein
MTSPASYSCLALLRQPGARDPLRRAAATNSDSREGEPPAAGPRHDPATGRGAKQQTSVDADRAIVERQPSVDADRAKRPVPIPPCAAARPDLFHSTRL